MRLSLIGGFVLSWSGGDSVDLSDPARRLVAFLALHGKPLPRAFVAGRLWPDKPESRALANLRSALWALHGDNRRPAVQASGITLRLEPTIRVDVESVRAEAWSLIERERTGNLPAPAEIVRSELVTDRDLLFADLLPGWYDEWVLVEQERFGELQLHTLDVLVKALVSGGRYTQAINLALRLVALDPLRERSQLALIRAYIAEGSFGRARRQHRSFCELMESSFGRGYDRSFDDVCQLTRADRQTPDWTATREAVRGLPVGAADQRTMS